MMTTISKADRSRLTIPGIEDGQSYLVKKNGRGWWVEPVPEIKPERRRWAGPKKDLTEYLDELAREGFSFEPLDDQPVPPCQF